MKLSINDCPQTVSLHSNTHSRKLNNIPQNERMHMKTVSENGLTLQIYIRNCQNNNQPIKTQTMFIKDDICMVIKDLKRCSTPSVTRKIEVKSARG